MVADEGDWQAFADRLLDLASMGPGRPDLARAARAGAAMSPFKARRVETMLEAAQALRLMNHRGRVACGPDGVLAFRDRLVSDPGLRTRMGEELGRPPTGPREGPRTAIRSAMGAPAPAPLPSPVPVPVGDEAGWHRYARNLLQVAGLDPSMPKDEEIAASAAAASPYHPGRIVVMLRAARWLRGVGIVGTVSSGPDAVLAYARRVEVDPFLATDAARALGAVAPLSFTRHRPDEPGTSPAGTDRRGRPPGRTTVPPPAPVAAPLAGAALSGAVSRVEAALATGLPVNDRSGVHPGRFADPSAWVEAYALAARGGGLGAWRDANLRPRRHGRHRHEPVFPVPDLPAPAADTPSLVASPPVTAAPESPSVPARPAPERGTAPLQSPLDVDAAVAERLETLKRAEAVLSDLMGGGRLDPAPAVAGFLSLAAGERIGSAGRAALAFGAVACLSLSGDVGGAALLASDWALPGGLGPLRAVALAACCPGLRRACASVLVGHPGWMAVSGMPAGPMAYYDAALLLRPLYEGADHAGRGALSVALAALAPGGEAA